MAIARALKMMPGSRSVETAAARVRESSSFRYFLAVSILHLPLGLFDYYAGIAALLHPAAVFALGLYWAYRRENPLSRVAFVVGYLIGVEILWRMAQIPIFWEFGKYGSAIIMIVALFRRNRVHIPRLPLIYFVLLLPACVLTFMGTDLAATKDALSFNLSGPFFLFVSCWFFSYVRLDQALLKRLFESAIVPLLSVAFVTLFFTLAVRNIEFTDESNFATSGGFGPNQVSSMLGLGLFFAVFTLIALRNNKQYRVFLSFAAIFFAAQSMMTFSRGGVYNAGGALILVALFQFGDPTKAMKRILPVIAVILVFVIFAFPVLNDFTGGSLLERFEDTQATHRAEIAVSDVDLFLENPIFGVGVGRAYSERAEILGFKAASHTEFSRLLAEHGIFGVAAILLLIAIVVTKLKQTRSQLGRSLVIGVAAWSILFMLNTGMRLAAPSAVFGMMFINIVNSKRRKKEQLQVAVKLARASRRRFPVVANVLRKTR